VLAVLNAVVIGISFMFVKMTLDYASPIDSLTFRFAAALVILFIMMACGIFKLNYRGKPLHQLLLLASMYPIGFFMLQAFGLQYATSVEGGIINAFTPVVTMVLAAAFLREATSYLQKLSTMLSVFGVLFIFIMKGSSIDFSKQYEGDCLAAYGMRGFCRIQCALTFHLKVFQPSGNQFFHGGGWICGFSGSFISYPFL
jgi:drug/metabolite transporter (DMT)-like permease